MIRLKWGNGFGRKSIIIKQKLTRDDDSQFCILYLTIIKPISLLMGYYLKF